MNNPNAKTISVKGYLSPDVYLANKAVFDPVGLSMSAAIGLGLQQLAASIRELDPAHRTRREGAGRMPKTGLQRIGRSRARAGHAAAHRNLSCGFKGFRVLGVSKSE